MTYATMNKDELRTACKAAGIAYGKLNNDAMRAALTAAAPAPQPEPEYLEYDDRPEDDNIPGSYPDIAPIQNSGTKIEKNRDTRNGVTRPSAGGKCRAVWDALDALANVLEGKPTAERVRELAAEHGFDKTTAQVQFYRWRKFHGISGR